MQFRSVVLKSLMLLGMWNGTNLTAQAFPFIVNDEDVAQFTAMSAVGSNYTFTLTTPMLCGNAGNPSSNVIQIRPYYGNFVFGTYVANNATDQGSAFAGVADMSFGTGGTTSARITGDSSLVCYGLNTAGVRKPYAGLFTDGFEPPFGFDSSVNVKVVQLPSFQNNNTFQYTIDIDIPTVLSQTTFKIKDGFDASRFNRTGNSWCLVAANNPAQCEQTDFDKNLDNDILVPAGSSFKRQFIVNRSVKSGQAPLPQGVPLVFAALFSPPSLKEARLDNNVSAGFGALTDFAPVITNAASPPNVKEGDNAFSGNFTLTDDTAESAGALIGATVKVDFNGSLVDATNVNCGSPAPITTPPYTRTCNYNVNLPSANFATDATPGNYAPGVYANILIDAVDPKGQHKTQTVALHVASLDNDAPVAVLSNVAVPDPNNGNIPTLSCDSNVTPLPNACAGLFSDFITGVIPGPGDAADELASQTVSLVVDNSTGRGGNIRCPLDNGSVQIFSLTGGPKLVKSANNNYELDYGLSGTIGSATCTFTFSDNGSPVANTPDLTFRIVVQ